MINFDSNLEKPKNTAFLTLVVVTYNRLDLLKGMLNSVVDAYSTLNQFSMQVRIGINGHDQATSDFLKAFKKQKNLSYFEIYQIENRLTPAEARNLISKDIQSEWILFLDDDITVPQQLFKSYLELTEKYPQAVVWGGPNLTPQTSSLVEKKIGWLLESFFVVGPIAYRYKATKGQIKKSNEFFLTLCNLFIKTSVFKENYFNPKLKTAEENELIFRVIKSKHLLMSSSDLYVWHYRRKDMNQFMLQISNYGFGRGQLLYNQIYPSASGLFLGLMVSIIVFMISINPILTLFCILAWLLCVGVSFFAEFKEFSIDLILRPIQIWFYYFSGIIKGYFFSYKQKRMNLNLNN